MSMPEKYFIHHKTASPPHYDILIDRGDSVVTFRIAQFDMLALLDGTEVRAERLTENAGEDIAPDESSGRDRGEVIVFDSGSCSIEQWGDPVIVLNLLGSRFAGTLHLLQTPDCYSMRYVRSRTVKKSR